MTKKLSKPSRSKSTKPEPRRKAAHASTIYLLHQAYLSYRDLLEESSRKFNQTPGAAMVLSLIERNPGVSAAQLAKLLQVAPQSINVHIASLISQGLIEREVDQTNRRALMLKISAGGRKTLKRSRAAFAIAEEAVSGRMSEETWANFRPMLVELIEAIRAHRKENEQVEEEREPESFPRSGLNLL